LGDRAACSYCLARTPAPAFCQLMMPDRPEMPTLVLRNVPEDLYLRLKETAAEHRLSMTQ